MASEAEPRSQTIPTTEPEKPTAEPVTITGANGETQNEDPFAGQRTGGDVLGDLGASPPSAGLVPPTEQRDRRMSREWDASKVPPSQFQKRKGSIYATPGSRDGHVERNDQTAYKEKLKEKGWHKVKNILGK
ncbi:MAG: hypothetical protein M1814_000690 [Vezdaea aestivalis]|nr:MAG: hypothetical protein M1814_000690 [Vezdaea aestivalis]